MHKTINTFNSIIILHNYTLLGRADLPWNISTLSKNGLDIYRFSNSQEEDNHNMIKFEYTTLCNRVLTTAQFIQIFS